MTRVVFQPPDALRRPKPPEYKPAVVPVPTPDAIEPDLQKRNPFKYIVAIVMLVVIVGMMFMMIRLNGGQFNPMMMMMPLMLFAGMGYYMFNGSGHGGKTAKDLREDRKRGSRRLGTARDKTLIEAQKYHDKLVYGFPDPAILWHLIGSPRMWEVTGGDEARKERFTAARYGRGRTKPLADIENPEAPDGEFLDPVPWVQTLKFLHTHSTVANMPLALTLRNKPLIIIGGHRENAIGMVRAMLAGLVTFHAPDKLRIVVMTDNPDTSDWAFAKWLPNTQHPTLKDALGSKRMLYPDWATLSVDCGADEDAPMTHDGAAETNRILDYSAPFHSDPVTTDDSKHTVVIVDSGERAKMTDPAIKPLHGVTWILIDENLGSVSAFEHDTPGAMILEVDAGHVVSRSDTDQPLEPPKEIAIADYLDDEDIGILARRLARYEPESVDALRAREQSAGGRDWASLVGVDDPGAIDVVDFWQRIRRFDDPRRLNFPIGFGPDGQKIYLNMREASQGGTGPHGEMIGTSGSGKSEFLRCLLLDACLFHPPSMLNLLLVDFKGGATYQGMEDIPHVAGVVTNLEKSESMVDRMMDVITGELKRRQQIFDDSAAKYPSFNIIGLTEYEKARESGHCPDLEPMPALVVLIDEYTELLEAKPEFVNIFSQIGRVGRSVGVHLLLASQNAEMARSRGLESNIHYHIALRTGTAGDSRAVIGVPDAKNLPGKPGNGLMKTLHDDDLIRFYAGFTGKPYFPPIESIAAPTPSSVGPAASQSADTSIIRDFTAAVVELPDVEEEEVEVEVERTEEEKLAAPSTFTVVKELIKKAPSKRAYTPWLPELTSTTLDIIAPELFSEENWKPPTSDIPAQLRIPFGLFDDPLRHKQPRWDLDLSGGDGNVLIYSAPQKGKSTAAMTIVTALALTHTPDQVQFFVIDLVGTKFLQLERLPHVARVAMADEPDAIQRVLTQVKEIREERGKLFRQNGIHSMGQYRQLRAQPNSPLKEQDAYGDIFIVIDGLDAGLQPGAALDEKMPDLEHLAAGGLNYGLHFIITTGRNSVLRGLGAHLHTLIEGHISQGGHDMSMVNSLRNGKVPDAPGRFITLSEEFQALAALPRIDGDSNPETTQDGILKLVDRVAAHWEGDTRTRLLALPEKLPEEELLAMVPPARNIRDQVRVPFGLQESDGMPAYMDFGSGMGHMLIVGERGSGRSNTVHALIEGISARFADRSEAVIALLDPSRVHMGSSAPNQKLIAHYGNEPMSFLLGLNELFLEWFDDEPENQRARRVPDGATTEQLAARDWWNGPEVFVIIEDYDDFVEIMAEHPVQDAVKQYLPNGALRGIHFILTHSDDTFLRRRSSGEKMITFLMSQGVPVLVLSADRFQVEIQEQRARRYHVPGRGTFHPGKKQAPQLVQVAWSGLERDDVQEGTTWG